MKSKIPKGRYCGIWIKDGTGMGNMKNKCKHIDYYDGHWCGKYPDEMTMTGGMETNTKGVLKCPQCRKGKDGK